MKNIYKRHRFPPSVIQHAVWLYYRFNLSVRDVEDLLAERNITVSYEAIRLWINNRPRKCLDYRTSHEVVQQALSGALGKLIYPASPENLGGLLFLSRLWHQERHGFFRIV